MPPRLPLRARALRVHSTEAYICPSCLFRAGAQKRSHSAIPFTKPEPSPSRTRAPRPRAHAITTPSYTSASRVASRAASNGSLASRTAVNAPSTVPHSYRDLHQSLLALQEAASSHVDLSRLKLATRSLESERPTIRIALLGLAGDGALAARKLARVLLSDPLEQEQAWEKDLIADGSDGRSVLLKYGDAEDAVQSNPLVRELRVPAPFLERHNLEFLVTALNTRAVDGSFVDSQERPEDAALVPTLTTPNSAGGRVGFVRYPVHRAVVVGEGVSGAVAFGRAFSSKAPESHLVSAALSLPLRPAIDETSGIETSAHAVDIDMATHALGLFRANRANGAKFSEEWQQSRVSSIAEWMVASTKISNEVGGSNSVVHQLISSMLTNTSSSISNTETSALAAATAVTVPEAKRVALQSAIADWCADAHQDLQLNLTTAFESRAWRRTRWLRLFWRIDDVSISMAEIMRSTWLSESEQRLAFLSGKIVDAGLASGEELKGSVMQLLSPQHKDEMKTYEANKLERETMAEVAQMPSMLSRVRNETGVNVLFDPPWPQNINFSRQYLLHTLVPDLHRKAQTLLLSSATTIGGSAAFAVWYSFATAGFAFYESGAIAALGLVWGMRSLQKRWGVERAYFASRVREDGRRVLGDVEDHLRKVVSQGGRAKVDAIDAEELRKAKEASQRCREALEEVEKRGV